MDLIVDLGPVEDLITAGIVALSLGFPLGCPKQTPVEDTDGYGVCLSAKHGRREPKLVNEDRAIRMASMARRSVHSTGHVREVANVQ